MTTELGERRRRTALSLAIAAAATAAVAFVTVSIEVRSAQPDAAHGLVMPDLVQQFARAQRILVTSPEGAYRIERSERGWTMRDRGDFPVNGARIEALRDGLSRLSYARRMTSDPARHARLGVTDPREGGAGVLVQVEDGQGALLANAILGVQTGGVYYRRPGDTQTWAVSGELPPLRDAAYWLDLRPLAIQASSIARVEIVPNEGRPYILAREEGAGDFAIVAPARFEPLAPSLVTAAAEQITRLQPIDVQTAPAIQGPPVARVRVRTADGLLIDGELIERDGKTWLKLQARAENPEQEAAALAINNASGGWAYALAASEAVSLAPPLSALLPHPPEPPRAPPE